MAYEVEKRDDFWFVVDPELKVELVTVFDYPITASEICEKVNARYPFFQSIPTVLLGSPYPRKNTIVPGPFPRKVKV